MEYLINIVLIYGHPGTGKTSTISSIASAIDSDIYIIPMCLKV